VLKYGVLSKPVLFLPQNPLFIEFFMNKVMVAIGVCLIFWVLISVEAS
jgi:hypothetical protein